MGYGDNRYDTERYGQSRGREYGSDRSQSDRGWRGDNPDRDRYAREGGRSQYRSHDDDRGFFDRAGDEVRSWFGDDEAERRRQEDQRRWEREQGYAGGRSNQDRGYYGSDYNRSNDDYPRGDAGQNSSYGSAGTYGRPAETWGGSGFGGDSDRGRRFDRIDAGSTGTHGAHPMSSPVGGSGYGGGYGISSSGAYGGGSSAYRGRGGQQQQQGQYGDRSQRDTGRNYGADYSGGGYAGGYGDQNDRQYSQWRQRQIDSLDRDYDDYRQEHQSKFDSEFHGWREKRQTQRSSLGKVTEHMEVVGSDDQHIGTVDKVRGDRIILTKSDQSAGGKHHSIPCSWIDSVDERVKISKTAEDAKRVWTDEENNRALFERDDNRSNDGPHVLDRSFAGTYGKRDD